MGDSAFDGNATIKSVVLPDTVVSVGDGAFAGCPALKNVLVPASVESISNDAFEGSTGVTLVCQSNTFAASYASSAGIPTSSTVPLSMTSITCDNEVSYKKSGAKPMVTVRLGERLLVAGTDYTVSFENNGRVGSATATVSAVQGSGYEGSERRAFSVVPANVGDVQISGVRDVSYTGSAITPVPTVMLNGDTLVRGVDYDIAYTNNTNAGTATVTVTGKGSYMGRKSKTFGIKPTAITSVSLSQTSYPYDGSAKRPEVTVRAGISGCPACRIYRIVCQQRRGGYRHSYCYG